MKSTIAQSFTLFALLRFAAPTVMMMIFFSLYTIIDGMFVARFVGTDALSATNIIYPVVNLIIGMGIMLTTGGSALVAKTMGEGRFLDAKKMYTSVVMAAAGIGLAIAVLGIAFLPQIIRFLGATEILYSYCETYGFIMFLFTPAIILKILFDYFFVTAGRPSLGLYNALLGGMINIVLDYLFIVSFGWGIGGAAWATGIGYLVPGILGLVFFSNTNNTLHFVKTRFDFWSVLKACGNGYSEMVTQLSAGLTTFLFNLIMLRYLGETGVAAITIVLYAEFLLTAAFLGFSSGVAPILSYHFGGHNRMELRRLARYSYGTIAGFSLGSFAFAMLSAPYLVALFVNPGTEIYSITVHGFRLFSLSFLLSGFNIFSSGAFTAFSNGTVSAIISFLRSFVFVLTCMAILPTALGVNGVWLIIPAADLLAIFVSLFFIVRSRMLHGYLLE